VASERTTHSRRRTGNSSERLHPALLWRRFAGPAWALVSSGKLATLPVLPDVQRITVLVDHDLNGEGQVAAERLERAWRAANRTVLQLLPDNPGDDFNDIVLRGRL
jgi:Toprim domain